MIDDTTAIGPQDAESNRASGAGESNPPRGSGPSTGADHGPVGPSTGESADFVARPESADFVARPESADFVARPADHGPVGRIPNAKELHNDIARILQEVKLPERREFSALGGAAKINEASEKVPTLNTTPSEPETAQAGGAQNTPALSARLQVPTMDRSAETLPEARSSVVPIHTLKDDLQDVVRDKKMSLVHAVALEEEKRRGQKEEKSGAQTNGSHKTAGILLGTFALVLIIAGALYGLYFFMQKPAPSASTLKDTPLFFADRSVLLPLGTLSGADLKRTLAEGLSAPRASLGAIMRIIPTVADTDANGPSTGESADFVAWPESADFVARPESADFVARPADHGPVGSQSERAATIEEFLKALGTQASPDLIRAFQGNFLIGIYAATANNEPVLIIPVSSYERAFAGMLAWEAAMNDDLAPLFTPVPALEVDDSGLLVNRKFEDGIVQNYDVRVLKDDSGAVKMMYSFPTRNMLVIVEGSDSFTEVLGRLRAARQL